MVRVALLDLWLHTDQNSAGFHAPIDNRVLVVRCVEIHFLFFFFSVAVIQHELWLFLLLYSFYLFHFGVITCGGPVDDPMEPLDGHIVFKLAYTLVGGS